MIDSIFKAASELKEKVGGKSEIVKILSEATNNDNWNISNSKLQVLADHTYEWNDYNTIMKHLWSKLSLKPKEWRKIFKALHALEYLLKNGAPKIIQDVKDDLYKIRSLQDIDYSQDGKDKCTGIRDKAKQICELIADQERLDEEREFARKNRDKFSGYISSGITNTLNPVSTGGSKYQGFGSQDLAKYSGGYNLDSTKNRSGYDPYQKTKGSSLFEGTKNDDKETQNKSKNKDKDNIKSKKKPKSKKKKSESDSSDSSSDSDESSSSSEDSNEDSDDDKNKQKNNKSKEILKPKESNQNKDLKSTKKDAKKEVKFTEQPQRKDDIFYLLEVEDSSNHQSEKNNQNMDVLELNFTQLSINQNNQNMFQNMNVTTNQNNMFASSQPFANQNQENSMSWMVGGNSTPAQSSPFDLNTASTSNSFGNANIAQPPSQPSSNSQATANFSLFDGMSFAPSTQPVPMMTVQTKKPQETMNLIDGFEEFQESAVQRPSEPLKQDSWSIGRHLFDLSNIK